LLEIIYLIQQKKIIGGFDSDLPISESEQESIDLISKDVSASTLIVFWQFIVKMLEELSIVSNPSLSLEMLVVRLVHLKDMPTYEKVINSLKENNYAEEKDNTAIDISKNKKKVSNDENEVNNISKDQIKNIVQTKPKLSVLKEENLKKGSVLKKISSFEDLIFLSSEKKEIQLKYDLEKNVNLVKFSEGKIDISFNENLDKNFVRNLSEKLLDWTGKRWVITLTQKSGEKTFFEKKLIKKQEFFNQEKKAEIYKKFKNVFSDAELIEVFKKDSS